ncbi:hypothetical protein [Methanoculleus chikugoensis]|uniref:hypothetical protein n=1 Tax=Methanoculleus chikugoensis TaxID=118126 RepID=UPI002116813A|nr:hypothetical protein [Methanoculleus chikugoensis]
MFRTAKVTFSPATGFPFTSTTFARRVAGPEPGTSRLGIDWGFAERSISTGAVWTNSTICDAVTLALSTAVALTVILPVVSFGP